MEPGSTDLNPQREQMADASMVRTLAAQASAIWPQERVLFARYALPERGARVLDAGTGTGEIASRLAELYPAAEVLGVDILDGPLDLARARYASLAPRLAFANQSIFALPSADAAYDLVVCRHVLQSVPHADRVIRELARVTKPGGALHLLAEDYGMLHFPASERLVRDFWHEAPAAFGAATGTDLYVGRHAPAMLRALGLVDVTVDYVVVDTERVARDTMAAIFEAWRDGYVEPVAAHTRFSRDEAQEAFDRTIASVRDPSGYAAWLVPIVAGRRPRP